MAVKKSKKKIPLFYLVMFKGKLYLQQLKKGVPFVHGRYTKEVPFLPKMVYKRGRGSTSGRGLRV